jgi:hypothetical protein
MPTTIAGDPLPRHGSATIISRHPFIQRDPIWIITSHPLRGNELLATLRDTPFTGNGRPHFVATTPLRASCRSLDGSALVVHAEGLSNDHRVNPFPGEEALRVLPDASFPSARPWALNAPALRHRERRSGYHIPDDPFTPRSLLNDPMSRAAVVGCNPAHQCEAPMDVCSRDEIASPRKLPHESAERWVIHL